MKNPNGQASTATSMVAGFSHILNDGDCNGHGYFLPKQAAGSLKSICNSGIGLVDVPVKDLLGALSTLSANQKRRLAAMK